MPFVLIQYLYSGLWWYYYNWRSCEEDLPEGGAEGQAGEVAPRTFQASHEEDPLPRSDLAALDEL